MTPPPLSPAARRQLVERLQRYCREGKPSDHWRSACGIAATHLAADGERLEELERTDFADVLSDGHAWTIQLREGGGGYTMNRADQSVADRYRLQTERDELARALGEAVEELAYLSAGFNTASRTAEVEERARALLSRLGAQREEGSKR